MTTLTTLTALTVVLAYLAVGSLVTRTRNRRQYASPPRQFRHLNRKWHSITCTYNRDYEKYALYEYRDCSCALRRRWITEMEWRLHLDHPEDHPAPVPPPPSIGTVLSSLLHVWVWPFGLYVLWLTDSASTETRRERHHRLELENAAHIAEMTAVLADSQETLGDLLAAERPRSTLDLDDDDWLRDRAAL